METAVSVDSNEVVYSIRIGEGEGNMNTEATRKAEVRIRTPARK